MQRNLGLNEIIDQYVTGKLEDLSQGLAAAKMRDNAIEVKLIAIACYHQSDFIKASQAAKILLEKRYSSDKPFDLQEKAFLRQMLNFLLEKRSGTPHPFQEAIQLLENILLKLSDLPVDMLEQALAFSEHRDLLAVRVSKEIKEISDNTPFQN